MTTTNRLIADRTRRFDSSGIRRVFELAAKLRDPVNLSIGQPDFDVPEPVKEACIAAIRGGRNSYSLTQGIAPLCEKLEAQVRHQFPHADRKLFVTSGTSGGLQLAMLALVNPGDEVVLFDPYFVMYKPLVELMGGHPVVIDTFPDFRIDVGRVADAITERTKLILVNSPANPTGRVADRTELQQLAELAASRDVLILSDEIYSCFCYDESFVSPAEFNERTLVINGFSKSHGMTGWRLGYAHGPAEIIETMIKLQQYTYVCAPHPVQWAGLTAMDVDMSDHVRAYRGKRDRIVEGLRPVYDLEMPGGAFYCFPRVPHGRDDEFFQRAVEQNLLIVPGHIFSQHHTHFRLSYAADDATIDRGIEILLRLAK